MPASREVGNANGTGESPESFNHLFAVHTEYASSAGIQFVLTQSTKKQRVGSAPKKFFVPSFARNSSFCPAVSIFPGHLLCGLVRTLVCLYQRVPLIKPLALLHLLDG